MSLGRVLYRVRQFQLALRAVADPEDLERARSILTPVQMALFTGMQSSEQVHALSVYRQLADHGETLPDLLAAALLHDVGKSRCPLHLWERVLIVFGKVIFPAQARGWGSLPSLSIGNKGVFNSGAAQNTHISGFSPPSLPVAGDERGKLSHSEVGIRGWKRAFVVAEQHPAWGAELAAKAGASPRTVTLIRHHQDHLPAEVDPEIERLLGKLRAVDDHN